MSAIFEMPIASETLDPDEITKITGTPRKADQIQWLNLNGWAYHTNRAGAPIVGRLYARLKMAGINPLSLTTSTGWMPDFSKVQ